MGGCYLIYEKPSEVGVAVGGQEICGLLDGDGIAGEEFSGGGFLVNTSDFVVELFDCRGRVAWSRSVVGKKEKDNAETQSGQSRRRDGAEPRRSGRDGESSCLSLCGVSRYFSLFILFNACRFAVSASD